MEPVIALVVLVVFGIPLALAVWLSVRAVSAKNRIDELSRRIATIESELYLRRQSRERESAKTEAAAAPQPEPLAPAPIEPPKPIIVPQSIVPPVPPPIVTPPPLSSEPQPVLLETLPPLSTVPEPLRQPSPKINWEQFMGVKGFAWLGGFALFLGVAFFVKYSFDNNLVPPELRVAIGFLAGLGLLVGGVVTSRRNILVLSQTLCATGIVILYAVTFACRSIYHFELFGPLPTFLLMVLITTTAFLLAVRLDALVVAILGMLGGFLTPILLSTGQDNPLGLFGYVAILDLGLIVVALARRWHVLTALAALGTAVLQIGWAGKFFVSGQYFAGDKVFIALAVLLGFNALWLAANGLAKRRGQINQWLSGSALGLVAVALAFTTWFLDFPPLAQRPWLMFGFVFLIDLVAIAVARLDKLISYASPISGFAVFGLLTLWTTNSLSKELLNAGLVFYFAFAVLHSALPAWFQRQHGVTKSPWANHLYPILALALVLVPVFKIAEVSFIVWPFILLVDLLAIALAALTATLLPVIVVLLLTLAATGALIFKIPADLTGLPASFFLLGAFVVFFVGTGIWLVRKFKPEALKTGAQFGDDFTAPGDLAAILPAFSVVLPFLLLIMATLRLQLINPSPVFGLALLLVVLLLGVTKLFSFDWMPAIGLASVTALECAWHFNRFDPSNLNQPLDLVLAWYLIFFAVFAVFPFLFLQQFKSKIVPWAAAAMAGPPQFFLIHRFVAAIYPNHFMGLLPAAFAVPGLLSLAVVLKTVSAENKARLTQLAWFGGVALFFITLIFPIQFDRQWITIGWALEGAALLWLFHRVPHPGLRLVGAGLLAVAFVRLALNPAVFEYHPRAVTPIFNWYLYAYGLVTVALFTGAKLVAPPRNQIFKINAPPILAGLGTLLAFLLLNIEIADYFSTPGSTLTFQFSGNFARDMTYSIAWALFALGLLVRGILKNTAAARYAAMGLLCVTLLKLFFHDLARLGQLYRIGAFVGVAVIAMLASFAYQKFFAASAKNKETKDEMSQ
jgi:type II secretory pathway pseudopilin PulG